MLFGHNHVGTGHWRGVHAQHGAAWQPGMILQEDVFGDGEEDLAELAVDGANGREWLS